MQKVKTIGTPSLIVASIAGLIFAYVIYTILFEEDYDWILLLSVISIGLAITSIALYLQKSHKDEINFERQMDVQNENLNLQNEQLDVLRDIRKKQDSVLPSAKPDWDPWPIIIVLILIVLFIPLIIYVIYCLLADDN